MARKKSVNYVNNAMVLEEIIIYQAAVKEAEKLGKEKPRLPESIR